MSITAEKLYALLPAIYRVRDAEQGGPLEALMQVLAEQAAILEADVEQLYDDQFIETCAEWVVPYIGDLIGHRGLYGVVPAISSPRAEVAHTIAYRRRKGTAAVLEQLAEDVTGWQSKVVEYFRLLGTTQHMNHVRPTHHYAPDLRGWEPLSRIDGPFDSVAHTVDVGHIDIGEGRFDIPDVGVWLWRLGAWPQSRSPAVAVDARRFRFHPLGIDVPLFNPPLTSAPLEQRTGPLDVPEPIGRRRLADHLTDYYGRALAVRADGAEVPVSQVHACNLADADASGTTWAHAPQDFVAVDPELGRIAFPAGQPAPSAVEVDFHVGFAAPIGGGEYERADGFAVGLSPLRTVSAPGPLQSVLDLSNGGGVVEIADGGRYEETPFVEVDAGRRLEIRAANGHRPTIVLGGELRITGGDDAEVLLDGLLIAGGSVHVQASPGNALRHLRLRHCTLVPGIALAPDGTPQQPATPSLVVDLPNVLVEIESSIVGAIRAVPDTTVHVTDSVVDALERQAVAFADPDGDSAGGDLRLVDSTVVGKLHAGSMSLVSNSLLDAALAAGDTWTAPVRAARRQVGCVRFSYVPPNSRVPRPHRCQPSLAVARAVAAARRRDPLLSDADAEDIARGVRARVRPVFTDLGYGRPGYAQLRIACPVEIRTGADDGAEIGALHKLYQPQRETNLRVRLDEYLRFGLEAGIFYAT